MKSAEDELKKARLSAQTLDDITLFLNKEMADVIDEISYGFVNQGNFTCHGKKELDVMKMVEHLVEEYKSNK